MEWRDRAAIPLEEVAEITGLPLAKVELACDEGALPTISYCPGGKRLVPAVRLAKFVDRGLAAEFKHRRASQPKPYECVYVIRQGGYIKIGYTTTLETRLASLRTGSPQPLRIIAVLNGGRRLEATLHGLFAEYRREGEWFRRGVELARWISEGCPNPQDRRN